jgi:CheY-like chemotaxis protein
MAKETEEQENGSPATQRSDRSIKVMLLDDDEVNNFICSSIIQKCIPESRVISFLNGKQGLDYLESLLGKNDYNLPDLIFLDINMPVMNGWEFLDRYKKIANRFSKKIVLMMLTASVSDKDVSKAKTYDIVDDYITKPLKQDELTKVREDILARNEF